MFSDKLERIREKYPQWEDYLRKIEKVVASYEPTETTLKPLSIAVQAELPVGVVIALLHVLSEEGLGRLEFQVVDEHGLEVASFATRTQIPNVVESEFGEEIHVTPENVEFVFTIKTS